MSKLDNTIPDGFRRCGYKPRCLHPEGPILPATLEFFPPSKRGKSGLDSWCRVCRNHYSRQRNQLPQRKKYHQNYMKQYRQDNADSIAAYQKQWMVDNADHVKRWRMRYYQVNANHIRAKARQYHSNNREKRLAYKRQWHHLNIKKVRAYNVSYRDRYHELTQRSRHEKPEVYKAIKQRRRARELDLPDTFTSEDWLYALDYFNHCCAVCGRSFAESNGDYKPHADHWIPLSSPSCPGTVPTNIVPLCGGRSGCNQSKSSKMPVDWLYLIYDEKCAQEILERIERYIKHIAER